MGNSWIWILICVVPIALIAVGIIKFSKSSSRSAPRRAKTRRYRSGARRTSSENPETKGKRGEMLVAACLNQIAGPDNIVLNDVILFNAETGKTAQIDHIFFCPSGIYVIETKTYAGLILGSENSNEWMEILSNGRVRNQFYSPVKQNGTHLYVVSKILGKKYPVKGLVVFTSGDIGKIQCDTVMTLPSFYRYMKLQTEKVLTPSEIRTAYELILFNRDSHQVTEREHISNIKQMQTDIENNICPRCGKPLVQRTGPYGEFYGCSGYPKCKFKKRTGN